MGFGIGDLKYAIKHAGIFLGNVVEEAVDAFRSLENERQEVLHSATESLAASYNAAFPILDYNNYVIIVAAKVTAAAHTLVATSLGFAADHGAEVLKQLGRFRDAR